MNTTDNRSIDELLDLDTEALTGFEAVSLLLAAHRSCARIEAMRLRALQVIERSEVWRADGAVSFAAWLRALLGVDHLVANREVRLARASRGLPTMTDDLASGSTSRAHLELVARFGLANQSRADALPEVEAVFAQVARSQPPAVLARVVRAWADQVDPMATLTDEDEAHRRRFVHLSQVGDGWHLDGFFGHEQGATLATALNAAIAAARRSGDPADAGGGATAEQLGTSRHETTTSDESTAFVGFGPDLVALVHSRQRADALIDLARMALASGGLPDTGGAKPTVVVTVPLGRLERVGRVEPAGLPAPVENVPASARGEESDGSLPFVAGSALLAVPNGYGQALISQTAARRLACDAEVQRVVLSTEGLPLDIGRTSRTIPPHLRRALNVRDGGCVFPGCDRPPGWTEAHHIVHWAQGGTTSLDNTALLCSRHHHAIHTYGHEIDIGSNGRPKVTLRRSKSPPESAAA